MDKREKMDNRRQTPTAADQETLPLETIAARSAWAFREYMKQRQIKPLYVALTAGICYATTWNIEHGHPILCTHAALVRVALETLSGVPYHAPIYTLPNREGHERQQGKMKDTSLHKQVPQAAPEVSLAFNDLQAIQNVLKAYLAYVGHTIPSPAQRQQIQILRDLGRRLTFLLCSGPGSAAVLTVNDIEVICEALKAFVILVRRMVARSPERDETLSAVEALRHHLETRFFA